MARSMASMADCRSTNAGAKCWAAAPSGTICSARSRRLRTKVSRACLRVSTWLSAMACSAAGPSGVSGLLNQGPDETKQRLLLGSLPGRQERAPLHILDVPPCRNVGLVADEHRSGGVPDEVPAVAAGALVQLAGLLHGSGLPAKKGG